MKIKKSVPFDPCYEMHDGKIKPCWQRRKCDSDCLNCKEFLKILKQKEEKLSK
jgi:hypothetical protein